MSWASRRMRPRRRRRVRRAGRHDTSGPPAARLQPVRLEEHPDRVGDLQVALLAEDQAVVGVRPERLVVGIEPVGQALRVGRGIPRSRPAPITRRGVSSRTRRRSARRQHLATRRPGLVRLLAEQVLDAQDVGQGQVAMVALQLLGERLPADQRLAVDVRDLAQLMRPRRDPQLARQLGAEQDERRPSASARPP